MSKTQTVSKLLRQTGATQLMQNIWRPSLTVLAYHRIEEHTRPDFMYFRPNISADPAMFRRQMEYVRDHYTVVGLRDVENFVAGRGTLPPDALLITFDDGYQDNALHAAPILREFGFPAVIFIVTGRMTDPTPLWWDQCAYYLHHTPHTSLTLPVLGPVTLTADNRDALANDFAGALKPLSQADKQALMATLPDLFGVAAPQDALFFNWDTVRELARDGILCQTHTVSHPIMTRIPPEQVRAELEEARDRIQQEAGYPATSFAYPNGMPGDYDATTIRILRELGYKTAYTLYPGPMKQADVQRHPYQIKRVFLSLWDTFDIFTAKVAGLPALRGGFSLVEE